MTRQRHTDDNAGHRLRVRISNWLGKRRPDRAEDERQPANDVADRKERLWRDVSVHFLPDADGSWHAGPDVGVAPLSPALVGRAWDRVLSLAGSEDLDQTWWHEDLGREVRIRDVERLTRSRFGIGQLGNFYVRFYGIGFNGVSFPPLGIWVQENHLAVHWWLGPDEARWGPDEVAALIEFLDELRAGAPDARFTIEWDVTSEGFVAAAETYLASTSA